MFGDSDEEKRAEGLWLFLGDIMEPDSPLSPTKDPPLGDLLPRLPVRSISLPRPPPVLVFLFPPAALGENRVLWLSNRSLEKSCRMELALAASKETLAELLRPVMPVASGCCPPPTRRFALTKDLFGEREALEGVLMRYSPSPSCET